MLSILRFLIRMREIHGRGRAAKALFLVCDNQGLVQTVAKLMKHTKIFPNTTMDPEWDIIAQILQSYTSLGNSAPIISHIKGHQDEDTPYEQLTLSAQLNCNADTLANAYLQEFPLLDYTRLHIFPAGACTLQLQHGTVTRDIKQECADARTLPPLRLKIIQDSEWQDPQIFDTVDWDSHSRALRKLHRHRPTLVKYIHRILPLGARVNKYDKKYPTNCPSCRETKETLDHFWKCQAASRISWRRQFLKDLRQKLIDLRTGPEI